MTGGQSWMSMAFLLIPAGLLLSFFDGGVALGGVLLGLIVGLHYLNQLDARDAKDARAKQQKNTPRAPRR